MNYFIPKFYFDCLNNFDLNESNFELTHFFYKKKLSDNEIKYKKLINKKFSYLKISTLIKLTMYRIYKQILFKIKFMLKKNKFRINL